MISLEAPSLFQYTAIALAGSDAIEIYLSSDLQEAGLAGRCLAVAGGKIRIDLDWRLAGSNLLKAFLHEAGHARLHVVSLARSGVAVKDPGVIHTDTEVIALFPDDQQPIIQAVIDEREDEAQALADHWQALADEALGPAAAWDEKLFWLYQAARAEHL